MSATPLTVRAHGKRSAIWEGGTPMIRLYLANFTLPFWASPKNTIEQFLISSGGWRQERNAFQHLMPGFPLDAPPVGSPPRTMPPIPTDVPVPGPIDVPVPEPKDLPPPDPGKIPNPSKPRPDEFNPKPRSIP
jgi:hypothetical protein